MEVLFILDLPSQTPCSSPIRLKDSLKHSISKKWSIQVDFLFSDKYDESFLQAGVISGRGQAFPKYPKFQVCNIFPVFQERGE